MTQVCPRCSTLNARQAIACIRCDYHFAVPQFAAPRTAALSYNAASQQPGGQQIPAAYPQAQPVIYSSSQPMPGMVPGPASPPPRRRNLAALVVVLVILCVLAGGGYVAYSFITGGSIVPGVGGTQGPAAVLNRVCHDLVTKNYEDAYQYESHRVQQEISEQEFVQVAQSSDTVSGGVKTCTVSKVQVNGSTATGSMSATYFKTTTSYSSVYHMLIENGSWKVDSVSNQQFGS